jgi:hypothetical protein
VDGPGDLADDPQLLILVEPEAHFAAKGGGARPLRRGDDSADGDSGSPPRTRWTSTSSTWARGSSRSRRALRRGSFVAAPLFT